MISILAIDLATNVGCADGKIGSVPRIWSWCLADAGEGRAWRFVLLRQFLCRYFATNECTHVVFEKPMNVAVMAKIGTSEDTMMFLMGGLGVVEEAAATHGKEVAGIGVQEARRMVLGWSTNKSDQKTKPRVMAEVKRLGVDPKTPDEADAAVLFFAAAARMNPRLAAAYTPLFREKIS